MVAKKQKDKIKLAETIAKKVLKLMATNAVPEVFEDKESEAIVIDLKTEDETGLLIGSRGDTLNSLQAIIGMIFQKKYGEWQRIIVNVSDWRERQEERLKELAFQVAERAKETGEPQALYNLSPAQRRTIHLSLSEDEEVETESKGEGRERYLIVRKK